MEWGSLLYSPGYMEGISNTSIAEVTVIQGPGSANTRAASYTQIIASSAITAQGVLMGCAPGTSNVSFALEVAVGASSSEVNFIQDFCFGANSRLTQWFYMPVLIPVASRISGRVTSTGGLSPSTIIYTMLCQAGPIGLPAPGRMYAIGIDPVTGTYGTPVTINVGSHNATWTQVIASTTADLRALAFSLHTVNTAPASQGCQLQIAVGAAASEVIIVDSINVTGGGNADQIGRNPVTWFPAQIPAGTRIAARVEGNATADVVNVAIYGLG